MALRAGEAQEDLFETFLGISGLGGVETPVYGGSHRNASDFLAISNRRDCDFAIWASKVVEVLKALVGLATTVVYPAATPENVLNFAFCQFS